MGYALRRVLVRYSLINYEDGDYEMGQYFMWLNPVKGEYIDPFDFHHGGKRRESAWVGCKILDALFTLMSNEWKGDPIVWIGDDYARLHDENNPVLRITERICGSEPYDYAIDHFKNVSCQFSNCDKSNVVTEEFHIDTLKKYGLEKEEINRYFDRCDETYGTSYYECKHPDNYEESVQFLADYLEKKGMFNREANSYHLIINNTKKEYIDKMHFITLLH
ncbi:MAG: hypothetical protein Q4A65_09245 [Bacillota bacterium]|nr:hypothetical protein [Bacillota bacterium]